MALHPPESTFSRVLFGRSDNRITVTTNQQFKGKTMLTYGGIGLLVAGIILTFFGDKIIRDPEQAAKRKKQGPIMALVGALALGLAIVLELSLF